MNKITPSCLNAKIILLSSLILYSLGFTLAKNLKKEELEVYLPESLPLKKIVSQSGPFASSELMCLVEKQKTDIFYQACTHLFFDDSFSCLESAAINRFISLNNQKLDLQISAYLSEVKDLNPMQNSPMKYFPKNFSGFFFNGNVLMDDATILCHLRKNLSTYTNCYTNALKELDYRLDQAIEKKKIMEDDFFKQVGDKTIIIDNTYSFKNDSEFPFNFDVNPRFHSNYKKALSYIEKTFLNDECFFQQSDKEIQMLIEKLNEILLKDLPFEPKGRVKILNKVLKQEDLKKMALDNFNESLDDSNKIVKHQNLMKKFVANLKKYSQQNIHPVAVAAWTHSELMRIKLFYDGNSRIARLLLNAILVRGGYEPVIFFDDQAYKEAVKKESITMGAFATYLATLIKNQREGDQFLEYVEENCKR